MGENITNIVQINNNIKNILTHFVLTNMRCKVHCAFGGECEYYAMNLGLALCKNGRKQNMKEAIKWQMNL